MRLAGFFHTENDAREMALALDDFHIANERDSIPWTAEDRRYRVFLAGKRQLTFEGHLPELPLRRWPSNIELVQRALARLRELDTNRMVSRPIELNPPLDEGHVRELEERSGISLPDEYRQFLTKVGNGGRLGIIRYMTLDEVLESNSASSWSAPLPAELIDLVGKDYIQLAGDVGDDWPGLLRISHMSYNQLSIFLSRDGAGYELWIHSGEDLPVCVGAYGGWLRHLWVRQTEDLGQLESVLAQMKAGATLERLEASLESSSSREWKHRLIGGLLGTGTTVTREALASWQAIHAKR